MYHKETDTPFVCRTTTLNEELGQVSSCGRAWRLLCAGVLWCLPAWQRALPLKPAVPKCFARHVGLAAEEATAPCVCCTMLVAGALSMGSLVAVPVLLCCLLAVLQVQYVLSDKTGTLTQNVMGFVWASIGRQAVWQDSKP